MKLRFEASSEKQIQAAKAWVDPNVTDIVYGGAKGGGKSYLGAAIIFSQALTYPGTRYFIARKQLIDLRIHTIPTIEKVFKGWGIKLEDYGSYNGQDHCYYFKNGSAVLLLDAKELPSDPFYERFGSMEMTQGWIEEAGEFVEAAMTNLNISIGRCLNDKYGIVGKLLQTCNPKKNYLYRNYYLPWKKGELPPDKVFIQAFAHENKKNESGYVERLNKNLRGVERERLLEGNWDYSSDRSCLIEYDKILDAFTNEMVPEGRRCITADMARYGGDRIVVIEWSGFRVLNIHVWQLQALNVSGDRIEEIRQRMGIGKSDVLIDEDGVGGGVVDQHGFRGFKNGASPIPLGLYDEEGKPIKDSFDNLKSQCYFRLAERINKNQLYLKCENEYTKQLIIEELGEVKQKDVDNDLKKGIIQKKDVKGSLGRSPDFSDAIMMREFFELKPVRKFADAPY